ncbi:hypothetical protein GE09DRAFT_510472 [Coniochaeta sp. 2T2.1]|nr:hypothetical protein GE09DRAFT_510472 [Coniochaeta sp. 2T2.1]
MQEFNAFLAQPKPKLPFLWPGTLNLAQFNPIPYKFRPSRKLRMRQRARSAAEAKLAGLEDITKLSTSFNVLDTLRHLRRRQWKLLDFQYAILAGFLIFCMVITPPAPFIKLTMAAGYSLLLLMPITQQFFLPSLSIWTYLIYFFSSRFIPTEVRPHIWVKVLPALENVLYGANLSNILSAHTHPLLDIIAWIPYGLGHFGLPLIVSALLFVFAAPGSTPAFARAFGYMCVLGVFIQLNLPCTPPWYEKAHGLEPAHYGMEGSPAGLARIDALLGIDMYTTSFTSAPLPFAAFPSLHSADATLEALFLQYAFPRFRWVFITYVAWIWWATMYLNHHYAIDLVGGSIMAAAAFYITKARWMPRPQPGKKTRWDYEYVEFGDRPSKLRDEEFGLGRYGYGMGILERESQGDDDEWTLGSSSPSFDSLSRGASSSGINSPDVLSPVTPDEDFHHHIIPLTATGDMWDGTRPVRESEVNDVVVVR